GIDLRVTGLLLLGSGVLKIPKNSIRPGGGAQFAGGRGNTDGFLDMEGAVVTGVTNSELYGDVLNNSGTVIPGGAGAPGVFTIDGTTGTYTQGASAALDIDIGGYTAGSGFDQLNISSQAALAGTLNINLLPGFTPNIGDSFTIITYGSHTGDFQTV